MTCEDFKQKALNLWAGIEEATKNETDPEKLLELWQNWIAENHALMVDNGHPDGPPPRLRP